MSWAYFVLFSLLQDAPSRTDERVGGEEQCSEENVCATFHDAPLSRASTWPAAAALL